MVPPESIFGVVPTWVGVYLALVVALTFSAHVFYKRVISLILLGKNENRFDQPLRRLKELSIIVLGQQGVLKSLSVRDRSGIGHAILFYGFLSLFISDLIFTLGSAAWRPFSVKLLTSAGVKVFFNYLDLVALITLAALIWALCRRWLAKPHRLTFDLTRSPEAIIILCLIGSHVLFHTLITEAFYVASGGSGPHSEAVVGTAIGDWVAGLGLSVETANTVYVTSWWLHLLILLSFLIYIPFSKHMHIVASPPNAFFRSLKPKGALAPLDLEKAERFGAGRVQDLTWKALLDGYACAVCGRCTDSCPAHLSGKVLSPMHIVEDLKAYLIEEGPKIKARTPSAMDKGPEKPLIGFGRITEEAIWDCVSCGACMQECPVVVEHVPTIIDMRRYLVMEETRMPETAMSALLSLEQRGHPWRGTQFSRTDWAKGLEVKTLAEHPEAEVLFWVGCTAALEQRSQGIARSMAKVLKAAGVDFAILGEEERCTGDPARRMGNEYLYQMLAQQSIETLKSYKVKKIVTICPHCFNTIKNEYPQLGGNFEVVHYTQFVDKLIREGKVKPIKMVEATVAYHDSCYLGRYNGIYDQPRRIAKAIPGVKLVEMGSRCRERGFCCGAGGGHMWVEESRGTRINHVRTGHFLQTGAKVVGVSCPFCLQMLKEGIEAKGVAGQKDARDLLELLAESVNGANGTKEE